MKKTLLLVITHAAALAIGFAAGIYALPILIAPGAPSTAEVKAASADAEFRGQFRRDLRGSDFLHWGEGTVTISRSAISLAGTLAPGPDYKLYLSPEFVDNKADFLRLKARMTRVGEVKTFENFIIPLPPGVEPSKFNTVIVWCETFSMFISAAQYR